MTFAVSVAATTTTASVPATAPAAGLYQCRILALDTQAEVQKLTGDKPQFNFTGVPSGKYTLEMSRLDVNGVVIGMSLISATFDTGPDASSPPSNPDTVLIDVPTSLSIACTQE